MRRCEGGQCFSEKISRSAPGSGGMRVFVRKITSSELSLPVRLAKIDFGSGFLAVGRAESEVFENQGAAVIQSELGWLPTGALVEAFRRKAFRRSLPKGQVKNWLPKLSNGSRALPRTEPCREHCPRDTSVEGLPSMAALAMKWRKPSAPVEIAAKPSLASANGRKGP